MTRRDFIQAVIGLSAGTIAIKDEAKGVTFKASEGLPKTFLRRYGTQLLLDGQPFRSFGVNKHELFQSYYLADFLGGERKSALSEVHRSLDALAKTGMTIVRFHALPFWSAQIEDTYLKQRGVFWQRFDEMMKDCRERGIRLVPVLLWNIGAFIDIVGESLQDFANLPNSKSRQMFNAWVEEIVSRYRDDATILFWEVTNEANLTVDLRPHSPEGVVAPRDLTKPYKHLTRNPGPRDWRNHWSADEMAAFVRETASLIKSLDKNHLVSAGYSIPRPSAWHLWLGSLKRAKKMDWTRDSDEEQANYIRMIHPEPLDFVDCHFYLDPDETFDQLVLLKRVADELEKPVYVGEAGLSVKAVGEKGYNNPIALDGLRVYLEAIEALDLPLVLFWGWDDFCKPPHEPSIRSAEHKKLISLLSEFQKRRWENRQIAKHGILEEAKHKIQFLNRKWQEIAK
ncbi:MAG: cellulase family glycosylhydrolase [Armatimonadota bacterium]|nr:cellulase family glycosylhydrolase [Armatimonadota bacterium]MDW8025696.1 cellulase family glycosylhydrolase [Armatimonadota bacterium]MDW8143148.1 cellulase family glycosylhydrolase [Armatimonadota bacterium]